MNLKTKLTLFAFLLLTVMSYSQDRFLLKGEVSSAVDSLTIPGVNILVLNTTRGTTTNFDGQYEIEVSQGEVLQFSFLGFLSKTVIVGVQTTLNVVLVRFSSLYGG